MDYYGAAMMQQEDPTPDGETDDRGQMARLQSLLLPGVLALLLLGVLTTGTTLLVDRAHREPAPYVPQAANLGARDAEGRGPAALAVDTARRAAAGYFTLDHRHLAEDMKRVLPIATGRFRDLYTAEVDRLRPEILRRGLVLVAAIPPDGTATEYLTASLADVLVAVDVTQTSADGTRHVDYYRTRVSLRRSGVRWLVTGLDKVNGGVDGGVAGGGSEVSRR